jgi:Flp pilus assembly pilin Flp
LLCSSAEKSFKVQVWRRATAGNAQDDQGWLRMLQRPYLRGNSVASFFTELVMDQLPNTRSGVQNACFLLQHSLRQAFADEKGATAVEYGIMVALIAVVIIVAVTALGGR